MEIMIGMMLEFASISFFSFYTAWFGYTVMAN